LSLYIILTTIDFVTLHRGNLIYTAHRINLSQGCRQRPPAFWGWDIWNTSAAKSNWVGKINLSV